ncbi:MAG TPA: CDP-alcohol phosphatidyltransferase family protein [Saprospiraceae bacterium]|nr:CDP-alcohol phosphatidyltransferase family protein [Saprospiraceae bacterium]
MVKAVGLWQITVAWGVHLFTIMGIVAGFLALISIHEENWQFAVFWMLIALMIDGVDGSLARWFKVKEILPHVNGKMMDYVIDFANYALIPAFLFYQYGFVSGIMGMILTILILLVSVVYYGLDNMVTEDRFFTGFPVLWNLVMCFFVLVIDASPWVYGLLVVFFAVMHFVPVRTVYPTQNRNYRKLTWVFTVIFISSLLFLVFQYPEKPFVCLVGAYVSLGYFGILSFFLSVKF